MAEPTAKATLEKVAQDLWDAWQINSTSAGDYASLLDAVYDAHADLQRAIQAVEAEAPETLRGALSHYEELFEAGFDCGFYPKGRPEYGEALARQGLLKALMSAALDGDVGTYHRTAQALEHFGEETNE